MNKQKLFLLCKTIFSKNFRKARRKNFVIIANNCWGAELYKRYDKQYNTPFVGLYVYGTDYLKMVTRFKFYLDQILSFTKQSAHNPLADYPVGLLNDVEIHFLHYRDEAHASSNWNRRLGRMRQVTDESLYYFRNCDRDGTTPQMLEAFHSLPHCNKISFGIKPIKKGNHFLMEESENNLNVPDGVKQYQLMHKYVNIDAWIAK